MPTATQRHQRPRAWPIAAAALTLALAFAAPAGAQENDSSPGIAAPAPSSGSAEPQTDLADLEDEVMCPICGTALGLSESPQADREREFIRALIAEGLTKEEIKDALVAEYGDEVLAVPEPKGFDLAAWLVPGIAIVLAAIAIFVGLRRWRRSGRAADEDAEPADSADSDRLDADLARYDL
ncbi:MAG TPA: cytochrome c-type biogenesis protein CcmH [Solirubrobacterales bacterium]